MLRLHNSLARPCEQPIVSATVVVVIDNMFAVWESKKLLNCRICL